MNDLVAIKAANRYVLDLQFESAILGSSTSSPENYKGLPLQVWRSFVTVLLHHTTERCYGV